MNKCINCLNVGEIFLSKSCSEIQTKRINTLCGQNVELLNVKLVVHIVTTGLKVLKLCYKNQSVNIV